MTQTKFARDLSRPCAQYIGKLLRRHENYTGYQGFCFIHTDGDSSHISVTKRSCTRPISKVESHKSDRCSYYTQQYQNSLRGKSPCFREILPRPNENRTLQCTIEAKVKNESVVYSDLSMKTTLSTRVLQHNSMSRNK